VEQDIELIEKYLADQLSPAERTQVEERLQQDAQFARRMELIAQTRQAVDSEVDLFREDLDKAFEEYQATQKPSISFYQSPRLIAASILLLLGVGLGYFLLQSSNDPQELYTAYFQVPQENLTVRDDSSNGQLNMALEAYNQGNYQQALERFNLVLADSAEDYGVLFYSGICMMMLDQPDASINRLKQVPEAAASYHAPATWYLAMNHLKKNQVQETKTILQGLAATHTGKYGKDARQLLKKLP